MTGNSETGPDEEQHAQYVPHPEHPDLVVAVGSQESGTARRSRAESEDSTTPDDDPGVAGFRTCLALSAGIALIIVFILTGPFGDTDVSDATAWLRCTASSVLVVGLGVLGDMALRPWDTSADRPRPAYSEA